MSISSSIATKLRELVYFFRRKQRQKKQPIISTQKDIHLIRTVHGTKRPTYAQLRHMSRVFTGNERRVLRIALVCLVISTVWVTISSITERRVRIPAIGGRYTEAVVGTPQFINPVFASTNDVDLDIIRLVYSGLMRFDETQQLLPDLAASYTISQDKKVYTFTLRQDVTWHDGEPFTARDVVYTFETIQNEQVGSPLRVSFEGVTVEMVDDYTITFTLKEPFSPFLASLTVGIIPEHIWFSVPEERIKLAKENLQPIGTGPYVFKKLSKNDTGYILKYELERYPAYYRGAAYIKEFIFTFFAAYEHDGGAIDALRTQKVDGIHFVPSDLKEKVKRKHVNLYTLHLPQYTALFFNQKRETALSVLDTRKALAMSLDKEQLLRDVLNDEGQVIYSPVLPGFPGYNPEIEKTPFNKTEAATLLDKSWKTVSAEEYQKKRKEVLLAEWDKSVENGSIAIQNTSDESTGETITTSTAREKEEKRIEEQLQSELDSAQTIYRQDAQGNVLSLDLVTVDTPEYKRAAQVIASYWQDIGVKVTITVVSPRDITRQVLKTREYDVLLYGSIIGSDPDLYPFWHSSQITYPSLNLAQYVNRTADGYLEKARQSTDEKEIIEASMKFQETLLADIPAIFLHTPTYTYAITDKVEGVSLSRIFTPSDRFANVTSWYIETKGTWRKKSSQ